MKKLLLISIISISNLIYAQTTIDFESLTIPTSGYYNGSDDYSGSGNEETFPYQIEDANFYVKYADLGTFDYWSGFAYTNQTDLVTANQFNYAAFSTNGGGANGSSNYVISFTFGDTITFNQEVTVNSIALTNSVWSYHYMNGSDGSGVGTYVANDYFTLTITAVLNDGSFGSSVDFKLADFTNGNSYIINDWTTLNLTSLGVVKALKFNLSALDDITPYYFCMDDLVYTNATSSVVDNTINNVTIYPNPAVNNFKINNTSNATITIFDLNGRIILARENYSENETIHLENTNKGIYFVKIEEYNSVVTKKLILK